LNVPVDELFGCPTRNRVSIYGRASNAEDMNKRVAEGYTVIKPGVAKDRPARAVDNPKFIRYAVENFASLREAGGETMDIGIDFHGAIPPQTAKVLIKIGRATRLNSSHVKISYAVSCSKKHSQ